MPAAAFLSCACDEIIMPKRSAVSPIDPQIIGIAAHAILKKKPDRLFSKSLSYSVRQDKKSSV